MRLPQMQQPQARTAIIRHSMEEEPQNAGLGDTRVFIPLSAPLPPLPLFPETLSLLGPTKASDREERSNTTAKTLKSEGKAYSKFRRRGEGNNDCDRGMEENVVSASRGMSVPQLPQHTGLPPALEVSA